MRHPKGTRTAKAGRTGAVAGSMLSAAVTAALLLSGPAQGLQIESTADAGNPATYCEQAAIHHERVNGLPRALLAAVALAESGRYSRETKTSYAWPWTINAEGRAYYFKTKEEAVRTTQRLLDGGMRSIDIGCMQVNLRYHPDAFLSLEDGFDPMTNVEYAADFLLRLHGQTGHWPKAVAHYHSQTSARGGQYFARVIRIWENERTRVANASYVAPVQTAEPKINISAELKPAIGHATQVHLIETTASIAPATRPAPKVLDPMPGQEVRQTAVAAVGLRLTIADNEFADETPTAHRAPPRVLDPLPKNPGPPRVADALAPGA
jgi:hypothetical protein